MTKTPLSPEQRARGERLGAALKRAREQSEELHQVGPLAAEAGVSVDTIRSIESGRARAPTFFVVAALARLLGVALDDLAREATEGST